MAKYKITYLAGSLDCSVCPPAIVKAIFPSFTNEPVTLSETECIVEFEEEQTPVNLGPLIKVEIISEQPIVNEVSVDPQPIEEQPQGIISTIWGTITNVFTNKE